MSLSDFTPSPQQEEIAFFPHHLTLNRDINFPNMDVSSADSSRIRDNEIVESSRYDVLRLTIRQWLSKDRSFQLEGRSHLELPSSDFENQIDWINDLVVFSFRLPRNSHGSQQELLHKIEHLIKGASILGIKAIYTGPLGISKIKHDMWGKTRSKKRCWSPGFTLYGCKLSWARRGPSAGFCLFKFVIENENTAIITADESDPSYQYETELDPGKFLSMMVLPVRIWLQLQIWTSLYQKRKADIDFKFQRTAITIYREEHAEIPLAQSSGNLLSGIVASQSRRLISVAASCQKRKETKLERQNSQVQAGNVNSDNGHQNFGSIAVVHKPQNRKAEKKARQKERKRRQATEMKERQEKEFDSECTPQRSFLTADLINEFNLSASSHFTESSFASVSGEPSPPPSSPGTSHPTMGSPGAPLESLPDQTPLNFEICCTLPKDAVSNESPIRSHLQLDPMAHGLGTKHVGGHSTYDDLSDRLFPRLCVDNELQSTHSKSGSSLETSRKGPSDLVDQPMLIGKESYAATGGPPFTVESDSDAEFDTLVSFGNDSDSCRPTSRKSRNEKFECAEHHAVPQEALPLNKSITSRVLDFPDTGSEGSALKDAPPVSRALMAPVDWKSSRDKRRTSLGGSTLTANRRSIPESMYPEIDSIPRFLPASETTARETASGISQALTKPTDGGAFIDLMYHPLKCQMQTCQKLCNLYDGCAVICPCCGPYSKTRYCCDMHMLLDAFSHWKSSENMTFDRFCVRDSIPRDVHESIPLIISLHGVNTFQQHRQAIWFNTAQSRGDYFIFDDGLNETAITTHKRYEGHQPPGLLAHPFLSVNFADPEAKDRFRRCLAICLFVPRSNWKLVRFTFCLLRDKLKSEGLWDQHSAKLLRGQIFRETSVKVSAEFMGHRHACEAEWDGRHPNHCEDFFCVKERLCPVLGDQSGRSFHRLTCDRLENCHWLLRANRTTHPTVKSAQDRMQGMGWDDVLPEHRRVFRRGEGWDGAGSGPMETEGWNC